MISQQTIGAVNVINVRSTLQDDCLRQCKTSLEDLIQQNRRHIIINLHECGLLNSEALEFIVDAQQSCLDRGGKLVIAEPQSICAEILGITGIDQQVAVYRDMRSALADFAR